jgi:hypothetical protein
MFVSRCKQARLHLQACNVSDPVKRHEKPHGKDYKEDDQNDDQRSLCDLNHNFAVWQGYGLFGLDLDPAVDEAAAGNQGPSHSADRRANVIIFPSDRPEGTVNNRARICDFESGATP